MPTRTEETKKRYLAKAGQLMRRYERETNKSVAGDVQAWVDWLAARRGQLRPSTWRYYRAACVSALETAGAHGAAWRLRNVPPVSRSPLPRRTSRQRLRHLGNDDLGRIMAALDVENRPLDAFLLTWLVAGLTMGLRPCEWWQAHLEGSTLVVTNAKATNGRANGSVRTLDLSQIPPECVQVIELMLHCVRHEWPDYDAAYRKASGRLYRITRKLWPRRRCRPTLYSTRHQFRADAAAQQLPEPVVAAMLGHGSCETGARHYGRACYGHRRIHVRPGAGTVHPAPRAVRPHPGMRSQAPRDGAAGGPSSGPSAG